RREIASYLPRTIFGVQALRPSIHFTGPLSVGASTSSDTRRSATHGVTLDSPRGDVSTESDTTCTPWLTSKGMLTFGPPVDSPRAGPWKAGGTYGEGEGEQGCGPEAEEEVLPQEDAVPQMPRRRHAHEEGRERRPEQEGAAQVSRQGTRRLTTRRAPPDLQRCRCSRRSGIHARSAGTRSTFPSSSASTHRNAAWS